MGLLRTIFLRSNSGRRDARCTRQLPNEGHGGDADLWRLHLAAAGVPRAPGGTRRSPGVILPSSSTRRGAGVLTVFLRGSHHQSSPRPRQRRGPRGLLLPARRAAVIPQPEPTVTIIIHHPCLCHKGAPVDIPPPPPPAAAARAHKLRRGLLLYLSVGGASRGKPPPTPCPSSPRRTPRTPRTHTATSHARIGERGRLTRPASSAAFRVRPASAARGSAR